MIIKTKHSIYFLLVSLLVVSSCKKDDAPEPDTGNPYINNYGFLVGDNPSLKSNIYFTDINNTLFGRVPPGTDITNLVASFDSYGATVMIDQNIQVSGETQNNFTDILVYDVSKNGKTRNYEVDAMLFTGLPIINLYTENNEEISSKDYYFNGEATVTGGRGFEDSYGKMKIRGRGHSTWGLHPKKPYQMKFDDKSTFLGMPEAKKWIFLAEFSDKTLMRNRLAFEMGYQSNLDWTPRCQYAEVFINDEYSGTYNITEKVEEGSNRVNIGEDGYLLEIDTPDHLNDDDIYFNSSKFTIQIKEPEIGYGSPEFNFIVDHINDFEDALFGPNFKDPQLGYRAFIDMESFVDWFLINEIAKNVDAQSYSSIYLTYIPGGKIKMGPLWDFDLGFGNVNYADSQYPEGFWVKYNSYFDRMFEDPFFVSQVKNRFKYFYNNKEYFFDLIDEQKYLLRYAQEENDNKWDLFGNYVWPNPVYYNSHIEEVNRLKVWLTTRFEWLDNELSNM